MARLRVLVVALGAAYGRLDFEPLAPRDDATATSCRASAVAVGQAHTCALDLAGGVWCWGYNEVGQSAPDRSERNVLVATQIALPAAALEIGVGRDDMWSVSRTCGLRRLVPSIAGVATSTASSVSAIALIATHPRSSG